MCSADKSGGHDLSQWESRRVSWSRWTYSSSGTGGWEAIDGTCMPRGWLTAILQHRMAGKLPEKERKGNSCKKSLKNNSSMKHMYYPFVEYFSMCLSTYGSKIVDSRQPMSQAPAQQSLSRWHLEFCTGFSRFYKSPLLSARPFPHVCARECVHTGGREAHLLSDLKTNTATGKELSAAGFLLPSLHSLK